MKGGVLVILINIASYPILTSLYSPEDYGLFSIFLYTSMLFSTISLGRLELFIPSQLCEKKYKLAFNASINNLLFVSLLSIPIGIAILYSSESPVFQVLSLSLVVFLGGANQLVISILLRDGNYAHYNATLISQVFSSVTLQLVLYFLFPYWETLVFGYMVSFLFSIFCLNRKLVVKLLSNYKFDYFEYVIFLKENKKSWLPNSCQSLLNVVSIYILAQGVNVLGGAKEVGYFSLCHKLLIIPVRVFGNSSKQALLKELSLINVEDAFRTVVKATCLLGAVSFLSFLIIGLVAPYIIKHVFGEEWQGVIDYIFPISIWLSFTVLYTPTIALCNVLKDVRGHLYYELMNLLSRVVILAFFYYYEAGFGVINYLYFTSALSCFLILLFIFFALFYFRRKSAYEGS